MVIIKSVYLGELRTEAQHIKSENKIITDAPLDNQGKGEAFSPTDLVCAALTNCMMTLMGITAGKLGIKLEGLNADTTKIMAANPRKIAAIKVDFQWTQPQGTETQVAALKEAALTCPVALSLDPAIRQEITFSF